MVLLLLIGPHTNTLRLLEFINALNFIVSLFINAIYIHTWKMLNFQLEKSIV